jgi:hypothetical protein
MTSQSRQSGCSATLLMLSFLVFVITALLGSYGQGIVLAGFIFVVLGVPLALVQCFAGGRKSGRASRSQPKPPRASTKAEMMAAARKRYEETLAGLTRTGLDGADLKYAKQKAKQVYLKEINGLLT